ncbi:MAG: MMPL family transporter [Cellvibrionaceae bacterium]|nr:MMPL family transporter [Cellvibrionaceae bacterium]
MTRRINHAFAAIADYAWSHPWVSVLMVVGLSTLLAAGSQYLKNDASVEAFYAEDNATYLAFKQFQQQFGRDDVVVVAVETEQLFSAEFMASFKQLHHDLETQVPWVEDVVSLLNSDWMQAQPNNTLAVADLGDLWPTSGPMLPEVQQAIINNPLYKQWLFSADSRLTLIFIRALAFYTPDAQPGHSPTAQSSAQRQLTFLEKLQQWHDALHGRRDTANHAAAADTSGFDDVFFTRVATDDAAAAAVQTLDSGQLLAFSQGIERLVEKYQQQGLTLRVAGGPYLQYKHGAMIHGDILLLLALSLLLVMILLAVLVRTAMGVVVPLLIILLSLVSCLGMMGWGGVPITAVSIAIAPFIILVAVLDSVHIFGAYYRCLGEGATPQRALIHAFTHSMTPIVLTSLTTIAGFLSFLVIDVKPVADLGWLVATCTGLILLYTLLLLPALLRLFYRPGQLPGGLLLGPYPLLTKLASLGVSFPKQVLAVALLLVLLGIPGIMQLRFSFDVVRWFPEDAPVRIDTLAIDNSIPVTAPLEVVIDTGVKQGILRPELLAKMRDFTTQVAALSTAEIRVGRVSSLVDYLQHIHQQLNPQAEEALPRSEALLHQQLLLYEAAGPRQLDRLADRNYQRARITVSMSWADAYDLKHMRDQIARLAEDSFAGVADVRISGEADLRAASSVLAMDGLKDSYLLAAVVITLMLIVLWRSFALGCFSMLPNFLPAYVGLALMGYLAIPITFATVLFGGVSLGLAVDDTVHLVQRIRYLQQRGAALQSSCLQAVAELGPVLLITTLVLALGFSVFVFSSIGDFAYFGGILSLVMILALLFDVLLIPAFMQLLHARNITFSRPYRLGAAMKDQQPLGINTGA